MLDDNGTFWATEVALIGGTRSLTSIEQWLISKGYAFTYWPWGIAYESDWCWSNGKWCVHIRDGTDVRMWAEMTWRRWLLRMSFQPVHYELDLTDPKSIDVMEKIL